MHAPSPNWAMCNIPNMVCAPNTQCRPLLLMHQSMCFEMFVQMGDFCEGYVPYPKFCAGHLFFNHDPRLPDGPGKCILIQ